MPMVFDDTSPEYVLGAISDLRSYLSRYTDHKRACERLNDENEKLRELVRILAYCMSEERDCDRCTLNGADMPTPIISACDSLPDLLRELGIEVAQ